MGPFKIQNAYPGQVDGTSDDGTDFEIYSDVPDADLLELQRELKKLDPIICRQKTGPILP